MPPVADLARATLKRLLELNLPPTPENYRRIYLDLGGADPVAAPAAPAGDRNALGPLLSRLMDEWARSQAGLSQLQKIQQLEQLSGLRRDNAAWDKLQEMVNRWASLPARRTARDADRPESGDPNPEGEWRGLLVNVLRHGILPMCVMEPDRQRVRELIESAKGGNVPPDQLAGQLRDLWIALERQSTEQSALSEALLNLLRLILGHLAELVPQPWVGAQASAINDQLHPPLGLSEVEMAQTGVRDLLIRHSVMRKSEADAHATAKALIDLLVRKLGDFTVDGDAYNARMQTRLDELETTKEREDIHRLVSEVLDDSRAMLANSGELGVHLAEAQRQATAAQQRIETLESELQQLNQQLVEDPLTKALNRRGLDGAFLRESARMRRQGGKLSVAVLDLDRFKSVNDKFGHDAGDRVLCALVELAHRLIRPTDIVARLGGEEFMLLLPGTPMDHAQVVVERLLEAFRTQNLVQDEKGRRVELTFSAGVADVSADETFTQLYQRVDAALLRAKQDGRQRVVSAAPSRGARS